MNALPDRIMTSVPLPTQPMPSMDEGLLDLSEVLSTIWRAKWILGLYMILGSSIGLFWSTQVATPSYRATTVVVLDSGGEPVVDFAEFVPSLSSDTTVVNTELEIMRSASLMSAVVTQQKLVRDPEFTPSLRAPSLKDVGVAWVKSALGVQDAHLASLAVRDRRAHNTAIDLLTRATSIRNIPDSMVFEITLETTDAAKSVQLADAIADRYLVQQLETKFAATQQATEWLSGKVADLEIELAAAEAQTKQFSAEMELISAETLAILSQQLKETRDRLAARQAAINRGKSTRVTVQKIAELTALETELSEKISQQSADLVTLQQLEREATATRQIYEYFLNRLKETSVQQGVQQADARLISAAMIPDIAAAPRPVLISVICATLAGFIGLALGLTREAQSASFRTAEGLERFTGLPVMGQIPRIPARRRQGVLDYVVRKKNSAAVEAIRNLRTSILMSGTGPAPKVIMSTSSVPGEGKTTQTLALAHNLTGLGQKVLVIEGDIRRRVFQTYFGAKDAKGFISVMSGHVAFEDAVWKHKSLGIDILFGEKSSDNAADVFSSRAFRRLLRQARKNYDIVLIDTPPVLLVPDARVIGEHADSILYTVRWDRTRERQVQMGLRAFQSVGLSVDGMVLSQINPKGMRKYGFGEDYGTYANSGYYDN